LLELAGEGTWSQVFRARPLGCPDDQPAAYVVKLLHPRWANDPRAIELLRREALVGRNISHPHVVSVLEAGVAQAPYYLVMPWLEGATLQERLDRGWKPDLPEALWIARQAAEGLQALDRGGWMHGDVKPSNLMISPEGHLTLLDLGFARRQEESGSAVERLAGTFHYMAPEWITSAFRADIRSDIYSLGAVLYQVFTGRVPFHSGSLAELATHHLTSRLVDPRRLAPHLPTGVARLVCQMLAKAPWRRPQTPRALIRQLVALEITTFDLRAI
jgi:serine/threonine-protein kinase